MTTEILNAGNRTMSQLLTCPANSQPPAPAVEEHPLIVNVDGCLLKTDLLWEGLMRIVAQRPQCLPQVFGALCQGKAAFKRVVAKFGEPAIDSMPLAPEVVALMDQVRCQRRPVILVSGADEAQVAQMASRVDADAAYGTEDSGSLPSESKLHKIQSLYPRFDYVGSSQADLPIWRAAQRGFVANASPATWWRARRTRNDLVLLTAVQIPLHACLRALRPHQWAKNALLLLPALAAHLAWTPTLLIVALLGFLCFSFAASAVYIANDLIDLPHDRHHPTKRRRPFAAGELSIPTGILMVVMLLVGVVGIAAWLPIRFQGVLLAYLALTTAYTAFIKARPILDVITLAMLYAARVVAGATLLAVPLSGWFLAFSVFFFLSLALIKRVTELKRNGTELEKGIPGRGYVASDVDMLVSMGNVASMVSALVYCLYITGVGVDDLYRHPDRLWLGLPLLLYWQGRAWLIACRGKMLDDPVVFALRDRVSQLTVVLFVLVILVAM